jgi:hypothetical protein
MLHSLTHQTESNKRSLKRDVQMMALYWKLSFIQCDYKLG